MEPTIKYLNKEARLCRGEARYLVRRGHNNRVRIFLMIKFTLKSMIVCSRYNTITKILREEIIECILYPPSIKLSGFSSGVVDVLNPESNKKDFPKILMETLLGI